MLIFSPFQVVQIALCNRTRLQDLSKGNLPSTIALIWVSLIQIWTHIQKLRFFKISILPLNTASIIIKKKHRSVEFSERIVDFYERIQTLSQHFFSMNVIKKINNVLTEFPNSLTKFNKAPKEFNN